MEIGSRIGFYRHGQVRTHIERGEVRIDNRIDDIEQIDRSGDDDAQFEIMFVIVPQFQQFAERVID